METKRLKRLVLIGIRRKGDKAFCKEYDPDLFEDSIIKRNEKTWNRSGSVATNSSTIINNNAKSS